MTAAPASSCDFCRISDGERNGIWVVLEDARTLAFFPDEPVVEGHTLVIPRCHSIDIWEIEEEDSLSVMQTVLRVSHAIRRALEPEGLNLVHSSGGAAGQSVAHVHFHLVPRWSGDRMGDIWPESPAIPDSRKAEALSAIQSQL